MASNMTDFYETWNLSLLSSKEHIKMAKLILAKLNLAKLNSAKLNSAKLNSAILNSAQLNTWEAIIHHWSNKLSFAILMCSFDDNKLKYQIS